MFRKLRAHLAARFAAGSSGSGRPRSRDLAVFGLPAEREIFHYHDGKRERHIDPLVAWERYQSFDLQEQDFAAVGRGDAESIARVLDAASQTFGVTHYDEATGIGLTRHELAELFYQFFEYVSHIKKKHEWLPITWRPTTAPLSPPEASPTPSDSGSCSTPTA